jgi:hypothetical protein
MKEYDLIRAVVTPMGISYSLTIAKIENDAVTSFLVDNKHLFYSDYIYGKLLSWVYIYFEPVFKANPLLWEKVHNKDKYLRQLIYLVSPTLHVKFFHRRIDIISPKEAITMFLKEIGVEDAELRTMPLQTKQREINDRNLLG